MHQKNPNKPIKKWVEDLNRHFSVEDIQMAKRYTKRCSTLLISRDIKIKTTINYHFTPFRMVIIKNSTNNKCSRRHGQVGNCLHSSWECVSVDTATVEKSVEVP